MRIPLTLPLGLMSFFLMLNTAFADVKPACTFGDHMVMQYDKPVPVWGTANPGEMVTVKCAGRTASAVAGTDGKWMLKLTRLKVGGPYKMTIVATNKIVFDDVYVGEVWLASGQSNMDMTVAQEDRYWCGVFNEKQEVASANYPLIRVFDTDFAPRDEPQASVGGKWEVISPKTVGHVSAAAYFFARDLHKLLKMPIGLITTAFGASTAEAWTRKEALEANPKIKYLLDTYLDKLNKFKTDTAGVRAYNEARDKYRVLAAQMKAQGKNPPRGPKNPDPVTDQHSPTVLWNGMVAPLVPYAIRGEIWYQGESNSPSAAVFRDINEAMITDWRAQWGEGDFPLIYVQLANIGKEIETIPAKGGTEAIKREAQLKNLSVPNTAMVVAIDNADPNNMANVHCKNKQAIGHRLALAAEAMAYHIKTPYTGPVYEKMAVEGSYIRLYFKDNSGGLITKNGSLKGFAIAGEDKKFVWGDAHIEGNTVVVTNPAISKPVAVRYGWGNNPPISLYDNANLPASPFRTDTN